MEGNDAETGNGSEGDNTLGVLAYSDLALGRKKKICA